MQVQRYYLQFLSMQQLKISQCPVHVWVSLSWLPVMLFAIPVYHAWETVSLYAVGVLYEVNLTCHGVSFDMSKQTHGGEGQYV